MLRKYLACPTVKEKNARTVPILITCCIKNSVCAKAKVAHYIGKHEV